jgi:prepilin-type N-terminal cleavage/methylation domain-containing protein
MKLMRQKGFSLVELSIVMVVVGLLLGTTMAGLSDFIWHARNAQAKKDLVLIEEALVGYVISNGGLPCPDTDGFQGNPGTPDGTANPGGVGGCDDQDGYLPWADLGLRSNDPWDNLYVYRIDTSYVKPPPVVDQTVTFTLTETDGDIEVRNPLVVGTPITAASIAAIFFSVGPNGHLTLADASNHEDENLNDDSTFYDKPYTAADAGPPEYDDVIHWISSFALKSKMVQAQRLP